MAKKYKIKGHETFILREGWLTKGLQAVVDNPMVFMDNYGADALGVGTNMAKAIRYWMKTAGILPERSGKESSLTELGQLLYEYDPYFEDTFSLWLVHLGIVSNEAAATSWYLFFHKMEDAFTKEELIGEMTGWLLSYTTEDKLSARSVRDDCNALISMYYAQKDRNYDPEDKKISPFAGLGLLKKTGEGYQKTQPDHRLLHRDIVLYCMIRMLGAEWDSVSIDDLMTGNNSPGRLLNLNRTALNRYLDELDNAEWISVNRTAGLDMVYRMRTFTPSELIREYYTHR